jgi:APA family basic amino acid/polyamine antiporter
VRNDSDLQTRSTSVPPVSLSPTATAPTYQLARTLAVVDYFSLAFGVMIGVGWLVVMDDWLTRGGPLGALLGYAIGAVMLLPVGWVYGRLIMTIPDASAEVAYTGKVFPQSISFATGWIMMLVYFIVCPYEAVAIGKIAGYLVPALNTHQLYHVGDGIVYLPHLLLGLALTGAFAALNYRGVALSARFLRWTTFAVLALVGALAIGGATHGSIENMHPAFSHTPLLSILLVWQIVPYFLTGFDSVGKCAEEAMPTFQARGYSTAVMLSLIVGFAFYAVIIASVAYVAPWTTIVHEHFATAAAFEHAFGSRWVTRIIMGIALISLLKIFNANLLTASRLLFGLGRRGFVDARVAHVHARFQTPTVAIICVSVAIAVAVAMGDAILVPISEVGSGVGALGWMAACAAYYKLSPTVGGRRIAALGVCVTLLMVVMKILPVVPGHFTPPEWGALLAWCVLGILARYGRREPPETRGPSVGA